MQAEPQENRIPDAFLCPISQQLMTDPVVAADGHTYERKNVQQWFKRGNKTSPLTGQPLKHQSLTENHAIKKAIQEFKNVYADKKSGKSKGFYFADSSQNIASEYKHKIEELERELQAQRKRKQVSYQQQPPQYSHSSEKNIELPPPPPAIKSGKKSDSSTFGSLMACFGRKGSKLTPSEADLQQIAKREGWKQVTDWINSGTNLKTVEVLFLYQRGLTRIEGINCMTGLQRLGLHNNKIRKIENINRLVNLKYLGLGYNHIEKIENLQTLRALQELDLYQNRIEVIQNLAKLPSLKKLIISKNPAIERIGIGGFFQKIKQEPGLIDYLRSRGVSITIGIFF